MLIYDIIDIFDKVKLKYAIVGGYALALHGLVRATVDVDLVLSLRMEDFELAEESLKKLTAVAPSGTSSRYYKNA